MLVPARAEVSTTIHEVILRIFPLRLMRTLSAEAL